MRLFVYLWRARINKKTNYWWELIPFSAPRRRKDNISCWLIILFTTERKKPKEQQTTAKKSNTVQKLKGLATEQESYNTNEW